MSNDGSILDKFKDRASQRGSVDLNNKEAGKTKTSEYGQKKNGVNVTATT